MNKIMKYAMAVVLGTTLLAACDTDVDHDIAAVEAPVLEAISPADNSTLSLGVHTLTLSFDKNIFFASSSVDKLTLTGGELISAEVIGVSKQLVITAKFQSRGADCVLTIPEGVVTGPNSMPVGAMSFTFNTTGLDKTPVMALSAEAKKVYDYLLESFETRSLSAMMGDVAWDTGLSDRVYQWTGKYPAISGFDYLHIPSSGPASWIDYGDITPVKSWWDNGGLVAISWHWNVPTAEPAEATTTTVWTGSTAMPGDWSGNIQLTDDAAKAIFANAKVGDVVKVTMESVADGAQGSLKNSGWSELTSGTDYFNVSGDSYSYTIDATMLASLKDGGMIVSGHDYTATGVYLLQGGSSNIDYAFYMDQTTYDADHALTEGTWENKYFMADLEKVAGYLTLLKDAKIPVIWRPFHEAAGGWFWWGKNAASEKAMWIYMFNYFKAQGLDNLIWVWTTQGGDADWYPGDEYVDIVGRDLYTKDASECYSAYKATAGEFGSKMVTLSECGTVGTLSGQWAAGSRWLWFMPWCDNEGAETFHADEAWWQDAMKQSFVVSRDGLPSFK